MNFLKKSLINVVNSVFLGVINLVIGIVLARKLGPAGIGQYQLVVSTMTIIAALATFGIGGSVIYYINNKGYDKVEVATLSLKFSGIMVIIFFPVVLLILQWEHYFGEIRPIAKFMMSFYCIQVTIVTMVWPILMAELKVVRYALVSLIPRICLFILIVAILGVGIFNLTNVWIITGLSQTAAVAAMLWFMRRDFNFKLKTQWSVLRPLVIYGSKLNLSYIVLLLNGEIGILIIRALLSDDFSQVGYYSRAIRLGALLLFVAQSIGPLLYAKWSSVSSEQRRLQVERVNRCFLDMSILGVLVLILIAGPLILILYGKDYTPCVSIFRYLLPGITVRFLLVPHFRLYSSSGRPLFTSFVLIVNLVLMSILMVVFVPVHLARGAAIAFSLSNIVSFLIALFLSIRYFNVRLCRSLLVNREDLKYFSRAMKF